MPFTLAHPAAVLWLARGPLSLLALASGAVAPDLPYFLRITGIPVTADSWYEPFVNATSSHSLGQMVSVSLPLALVAYACGCLLLPPLRSVVGIESPNASDMDLTGTWRRGAWVVVALLIGILTHLAWDAMTELGGSRSGLLQHGSTVLGLLVVGWFVVRRRAAVRWHDSTQRRRLVAVAVPCALAALGGALLADWDRLDQASGSSSAEVLESVLTDAVKGAGAGLVAATATLTLVWWGVVTTRGLRRQS